MAARQPSNKEPIARAKTDDDEILDRLKTRDRTMWRMVWLTLGGIALVFAATATAIFSGHGTLVTGMWGRIVTAAAFIALFVYVFVTIVKSSAPPIETGSPRLVHGRMDIHQRRWRQSILFNVFTIFFAIVSLSLALPVLRTAPQVLSLAVAFVAGLMILLAVTLSAGGLGARELNDEFDSALRARTTRFGYILVMALLGAVVLVALWQPDWTLTAITWALYVGFAAPALYYLIGDWRASRGDDA